MITKKILFYSLFAGLTFVTSQSWAMNTMMQSSLDQLLGKSKVHTSETHEGETIIYDGDGKAIVRDSSETTIDSQGQAVTTRYVNGSTTTAKVQPQTNLNSENSHYQIPKRTPIPRTTPIDTAAYFKALETFQPKPTFDQSNRGHSLRYKFIIMFTIFGSITIVEELFRHYQNKKFRKREKKLRKLVH